MPPNDAEALGALAVSESQSALLASVCATDRSSFKHLVGCAVRTSGHAFYADVAGAAQSGLPISLRQPHHR